MAKRKKRRKSRNTRSETYPGWVWMLFGLSIGLAVAFAVYVKDSRPPAQTVAQPAPASMQGALDDNNETVARTPEPEAEAEPKEKRFTFYDMLPAFEMVVPDETPNESKDTEPQAILEPGLYILQAGSFSTPTDADRRRAELALHGIESHVPVSYTHLTLPTITSGCRSRWSPDD